MYGRKIQILTIPQNAKTFERRFLQAAIDLSERTGIKPTEAITAIVETKPTLFGEMLKERGIITAEAATELEEGGQ